MPTFTPPPTWGSGGVTSSLLNARVRDAITELQNAATAAAAAVVAPSFRELTGTSRIDVSSGTWGLIAGWVENTAIASGTANITFDGSGFIIPAGTYTIDAYVGTTYASPPAAPRRGIGIGFATTGGPDGYHQSMISEASVVPSLTQSYTTKIRSTAASRICLWVYQDSGSVCSYGPRRLTIERTGV